MFEDRRVLASCYDDYTRLTRNETRDGNLLLGGTVLAKTPIKKYKLWMEKLMKIYLFSSAPSTEVLAFLQSLVQHYVGNGSVLSDQVQPVPVTKYTVRANLSLVQVFETFYFTIAFCKTLSSPNPGLFLSYFWILIFSIQQTKCDSLKNATCSWIVPHYELSFKKHTRKVRYFCWRSYYPWFSQLKNWQTLVVKDWCKEKKRLMKNQSLRWIHRKLLFAKVSIMTSDFLTNISDKRF